MLPPSIFNKSGASPTEDAASPNLKTTARQERPQLPPQQQAKEHQPTAPNPGKKNIDMGKKREFFTRR
jgi:hypothetical protein